MAFVSQGTFMSQANKTAGLTWLSTTEAAINVGDLLILVIAKDNASTTDGETSEVESISVGLNVLLKVKEFCNGQGGANAGAVVSVWAKQNATAEVSGATVTITFSSSIAAKAATGWRFTMDNAKLLTLEASGVLANDGVDAGAMTLSGMVSREHLMIRGGAVEAALTTYGVSVNYTAFDITGANTTGGGAAANMAARGEFRIVTSTSETTDPTTSASDQASAMLALYESELNLPVLQSVEGSLKGADMVPWTSLGQGTMVMRDRVAPTFAERKAA
jgi:hypothetical protein